MTGALPNINQELLNWTSLAGVRVLELGREPLGLAAEYKRRNPRARWTVVAAHPAAATAEGVDRVFEAGFEAVADAELSAEGLFDVVVVSDLLEHLPDLAAALSRIAGLTTPGGSVVLSVLNPGHWTALAELIEDRPRPHRWITRDVLLDALRAAGLEPLKGRGAEQLGDANDAARWLPALADAAEKAGVARQPFLQRASTSHYLFVAGKPVPGESKRLAARVVFTAMAPRFLEARAALPAQQLNSLPDLSVDFRERKLSLESGPPGLPQIAIIQRLRVTDPSQYLTSIARAIARGWVLVVDLDDHPALLAAVGRTEEAMKWLPMSAAHAVQTTTPALAAAFRARNPEVALFPNAMATLPPFSERAGETPRVFYGALNREGFSAQVAAALRPCLEAHPEAEFLVVNDQAFFDALPTERKQFQPSLPYDEYLEAMAGCHILLTPLEGAFGETFKSDIKFLEASARGLATIASPVVYADTIIEGETGLLAASLADWPTALGRLLDDARLRERLARNGWDYVRRERMLAYQTGARRDWLFSLWERREALTAALYERHPELRLERAP